jgi:hypothetical protein
MIKAAIPARNNKVPTADARQQQFGQSAQSLQKR